MSLVDDGGRALYEAVFARAFRYARRHVDNDHALEVAHDVASGVVRRALADAGVDGPPTNTFVHRAVIHRLIDHRRMAARRAATEQVHVAEREQDVSEWANPDDSLDLRELERVLQAAVDAMPLGMRRVFVLVRQHDLSYRDVATRLGIGVGTVHTQLSRAGALLRETLARYRAGEDVSRASRDRAPARHNR